mgnify:CR=1 FL=1
MRHSYSAPARGGSLGLRASWMLALTVALAACGGESPQGQQQQQQPPVPVDVFITLPSMEMSSPAFTVITPPLPPVAELFMSPLFVPAASS